MQLSLLKLELKYPNPPKMSRLLDYRSYDATKIACDVNCRATSKTKPLTTPKSAQAVQRLFGYQASLRLAASNLIPSQAWLATIIILLFCILLTDSSLQKEFGGSMLNPILLFV